MVSPWVQERKREGRIPRWLVFKIEQTSVVSFYGFSEAQCEKIPNVGKSFAPKRQSSRTLNDYWNSHEKLMICFWGSSAGWNAKTTKTNNSSRKRSGKTCIDFSVLCF